MSLHDELGCRTYWRSHACDLTRGHDGPHFCCISATPIDGEDSQIIIGGPLHGTYYCDLPRPDDVLYGGDAPPERLVIGKE